VKLLAYGVFTLGVLGVALVAAVLRLDARASLNRAVAVMAGFSAVWAFCLVFVYASPDPAVALAFYHASYFGLLGVVPSMLLIHLVLAGVTRRWRLVAAVLSYGFSVFLLTQYLTGSFYYQSFRPGPWGNVGVGSSTQFWSSFSPLVYFAMEIVGLIALLGARRRARTRRLRAQLSVAALAIPVTYALYFGAWYLDDVLPVPPLEIFTGFWTLAVFLYLIVRYRYGRKDDDLIEKFLATALQDAVVLLDHNRVVIGANPAATRRLGAGSQPLMGRDFASLLDDSPGFLRDWERARSRRAVHLRQPCLIGGRSALLTLSPAYDRSGQFEGATAHVGDLGNLDENAAQQKLTAREKQVLLLLMQGHSHRQIADSLEVSPGTIKTHAHNLFEKTGAANRTQLFSRLLSGPSSPANVS
jgi:DNA-binding CsgD family transcriptional regulator